MVKLLDIPLARRQSSSQKNRSWRRPRARVDTPQPIDCQGIQQSGKANLSPDWHWLYKETVNRLDRYQALVNEGRELEAALQFARFIIWSRLDRLMAPHDCEGALKVDSSLMLWKARELERTICEAYRSGKACPTPSQSVLEAIHHKLDLLAGYVARRPDAPGA